VPPPHTPATQVSPTVQKRPSLHEVPSARTVFVQVPLLHASAVQALSSLQSLDVVQPVQLATGECVQPCVGSH